MRTPTTHWPQGPTRSLGGVHGLVLRRVPLATGPVPGFGTVSLAVPQRSAAVSQLASRSVAGGGWECHDRLIVCHIAGSYFALPHQQPVRNRRDPPFSPEAAGEPRDGHPSRVLRPRGDLGVRAVIKRRG